MSQVPVSELYHDMIQRPENGVLYKVIDTGVNVVVSNTLLIYIMTANL